MVVSLSLDSVVFQSEEHGIRVAICWDISGCSADSLGVLGRLMVMLVGVYCFLMSMGMCEV